ncbi:MAG: XrtA/PEP-CTERM system histidine kinase PrsK [Burkholderiales bacterium]
MNVIAWSYGLAVLLYAAFAGHLIAVRHDWRAGKPSQVMFAAILITAGWAGIGLASSWDGEAGSTSAASIVADVLRYSAWFIFLMYLLAGPSWKAASRHFLAPLAGLIVVGGLILGLVANFRPSALYLETAIAAQGLGMAVLALTLLEQLYRNVARDSVWNLKPLAVGLGAAFLFDLYLYANALLFRRMDMDVVGARGFVHALVTPLLLVSTSRTRDWVTKIRLSQKAAFHSATLIIVGGYLLFMAAVGYYVKAFGGDWGSTLQVALLASALLGLAVLVLSGSMRAKVRVFVGKHFFRYRYDYREEWLRFTRTLSQQNSAESLEQQVIRALADLVESPAGGLWLPHGEGRAFGQSARWNMPEQSAPEPCDSSLCRFLSDSGWVINLEEYRSYPARYADLELPQWLANVPNAWLVVPLGEGRDLLGFVVLSSARTSMDVNWEVNDLLRTAGSQAASFLARMRANDALLEARKFDAFNRMSAFVVHDLKNIVSQLSLMLKNAERHRANPEFQKDMLMTVEHSVERMRQLMLQLREGATPPGTPVGVDLAAIIERIRAAKSAQGRQVIAEIVEPLMTRGHAERIERVVGHVVQNALDATEPDNDSRKSPGMVTVRLARAGGQAQVEVVDNGSGMDSEFVRERLFKPFQTTKRAGMGIGAYESFQYVQELGGKISVESSVGAGTRISMLLPLFESSALPARTAAQREPA